MLSDDLRSVERFLARAAQGDVAVTAGDLFSLLAITMDCRQRARAMELHSVIAQTVTPADLADGKVVMLPFVGRDVRRLVADGNPGGGAA